MNQVEAAVALAARITRFARNPRIARVCAGLASARSWEGIARSYDEMRFAGLYGPGCRQSGPSVRLILHGARSLAAGYPVAGGG